MKKFLSFLVLSLIVALGVAYRYFVLEYNGFPVDSDEAIVGLMAKHILEGKEIPIFYYGQNYMGSLEAILTSGVFSFFGQSNFSLKLVPLFFSGLHIYLTYLIARQFVSSNYSLLAALFCALGPNALIFWSAKTRGGFIELVVLGSLSLYLVLKVMEIKYASSTLLFALGLVLGLGWWVNNQIVFYMLPIGLFCLVLAIKRAKFFSYFFYGIFGFLIGGAPFWYANIFLEPKWATFKVLFSGATHTNISKNINGFFNESVPMILGAKRFWSENEFFNYSSILAYSLFTVALLSLFFIKKRKESLLLITFLLSTILIFSFSKFGSLYKAPRYLLPLYSVIPVVYAIFASTISKKLNANLILCSIFPLLVLALQLYPVTSLKNIKQGMAIVNHVDRIAENNTELYSWLEQEKYNFIDTNYWIGYRIAFETDEKVKFRVFDTPQTARIKNYEIEGNNKPLVYVLVPSQVSLVVGTLEHFGFNFRKTELGKYVIIDKIIPRWEIGQEVGIKNIKSKINSENLGLMTDSKLSTRWASARPQSPGMSIEFEFMSKVKSQNENITAVELDFGQFWHDSPRHLLVYGMNSQNKWELLSDLGQMGSVFNYFPDKNGRPSKKWLVRFKPVQISKIKLLQNGEHPIFDWSIAELKVYSKK